MKDQSKAKYLFLVFLLCWACSLTACSYLTDFVVVNATNSPIEIRYLVKNQTLPIKPAVLTVSQLHQQTMWRELTTSQYTFDPDNRWVVISLMANEALRIEKCNLVDGEVDDVHQAARFFIEEIHITGSYGEIRLQGEQLRKAFVTETSKIHTLTYK